jgi:hypothetical protein
MRCILVPFILYATVTVLVGCSTGAQREAGRMQAISTETAASGQACIQNVADKPEYASLKSKTVLSPDPQFTLQMLNDKSSPNKQEISLLYRVYGDLQDCRKILLDGASKIHPLLLFTLVEGYADIDKLWAQTTGGGLTWGQFNESRKAYGTRFQQKFIQANMQIASQLQNQHQSEMDQRQRAAAAFRQWADQQQQMALQQQAIDAANRSRTINCTYSGNTAQCNSF